MSRRKNPPATGTQLPAALPPAAGAGNPETPPKRRPGRPKKSEPAVTPEVLEEISDLWCQGWTLSRIAHRFGVDRKTIEHHLNHTIRPTWEAKLSVSAATELAKIDTLERVAWERFRESQGVLTRKKLKEQLLKPAADGSQASLGVVERVIQRQKRIGDHTWLEIVEWCIEQRCKLLGHYAPSRLETTGDLTLRVAGLSPTEINEAMLERVKEKIVERRRYEAALAAAAGRN